MTSISDFLPKPRNALKAPNFKAPLSLLANDDKVEKNATKNSSISTSKIPPYGKRVGWTPKSIQDFGDGGAYPEIHTNQYPLDMGRRKSQKGNALNLQVDAEGQVQYGAIAKYGHTKNRTVQASPWDIIPADITNKTDWSKPSEEQVQETTDRTRLALEKIVSGKIKAAQPKQLVASSSGRQQGATMIKYTPANASASAGGQSKIIRMVEMPVDPMEPPKFRHKKIPGGPPSPPPPVMHSPPRKVSVEEQQQWNIPPCISNWKNRQGHTIPLDKRLAADGRGLQDVNINDNFAKLTEALLISDRKAREAVQQRAIREQTLTQKQKTIKEDNLRKLAQRARDDRSGFGGQDNGRVKKEADVSSSDDSTSADEDSDDEAVKKRNEIRRERQRQRERELRMSHMGSEARARHATSMADRDVSEKIALGLSKPAATGATLFDQRLFNRSEGLDSGFNDDEAYNVYDKPLFKSKNPLASNYRPGQGADSEVYGAQAVSEQEIRASTDKFVAQKGFAGATEAGPSAGGAVQFEKSDPFGVDEFLQDAKRGRKDDDGDRKGKRVKR